MLIRLLALLSTASSLAYADVKFTAPAPGGSETAGTVMTVSWTDSGSAPIVGDLLGYTLFLMVGGSTEATALQVATVPATIAGTHTSGASTTFSVPATGGPPDPNAYFLKMISAPRAGTGNVINYSPRFSVKGMTGQWPSTAIQTAFKAIAGVNDVPPTANSVAGNQGNNPGAAGQPAGPYTVPFNIQSGLTRYAPMQPKPGSQITAQKTDPVYPPSAWTVATAFLPSASIVTTLTQAVTYSASTSREHTASPAAQPKDNMQKFMERWRD